MRELLLPYDPLLEGDSTQCSFENSLLRSASRGIPPLALQRRSFLVATCALSFRQGGTGTVVSSRSVGRLRSGSQPGWLPVYGRQPVTRRHYTMGRQPGAKGENDEIYRFFRGTRR